MTAAAPTADVTEGRENYIGASEAHNVLDLEPYGCRRRLGLEKCGIPYDAGEKGIDPQLARRGKKLEPVAAEEFERLTGIPLSVPTEFTGGLTERHPWLVAHTDRVIGALSENEFAMLLKTFRLGPGWPTTLPLLAGLVEIKTVNDSVFRQIMRDGPKPFHMMQVQHQLLALGRDWAMLFYLHPDSFRSEGWIIGADEELHEQYLKAGDALWQIIERAKENLGPGASPDLWDQYLPAALDPKAPPCRKCPYRKSCQGEKLLAILKLPEAGEITRMESPEWAAAISEWLELAGLENEVKDAKADARGILESIMGDATVGEGGGARVYFKPLPGRVTPDGKGMAACLLALASEVEVGQWGTGVRIAKELRKMSTMTKTAKASRPFKVYPK